MSKFGLIGFPLGHSFSKNYFTKKFQTLGLDDHLYDLFEMEDLHGFLDLWEDNIDLLGLNVTVPFKEKVIPFLDSLDSSAEKVGAVNTIRRVGQKLIGYNTDYFGFKVSLQNFLPEDHRVKNALVLGSGGASKAVEAVLKELSIAYKIVSRTSEKGDLTYRHLQEDHSILKLYDLIINTTPVGMHPNIDKAPDLPFEAISQGHTIYDLVYNPEETKLMAEAKKRGARTKNGLEMLHLQADRAWDIWNSTGD